MLQDLCENTASVEISQACTSVTDEVLHIKGSLLLGPNTDRAVSVSFNSFDTNVRNAAEMYVMYLYLGGTWRRATNSVMQLTPSRRRY